MISCHNEEKSKSKKYFIQYVRTQTYSREDDCPDDQQPGHVEGQDPENVPAQEVPGLVQAQLHGVTGWLPDK